ncbi:GPI mannosyltransferase 3 [Selaginella moellendorffii]|uniref:GPI mannosyltransferase 3 n=1 Tax=Selaginella moellendorffii TaxID=88036 RepID=UPI000D1CE50E|nr:GPI mannosyltransferase 3 [Selaginella moellendorffii]|eukprot:XP_002976970.2 GPI mannosyltransferase 3 [Selaginella moellendorffii]
MALGGERGLWVLCIAFRLLNALLVRTYFNPDEHWQALEVAHRIVFGYGHLTWEWNKGLRSYLHPLMFAALYKMLAVLKLDTPWFMARSPRLFQSLIAAAGDVYLWKLSRRAFGDRVAKWTMFCQLVNWFTFFCMVRTLSSSIETVLTTIALFYWSSPTIDKHLGFMSNRQLALCVAWISCAIRPTSAVIWLYVGIYHLYECRDKFRYLLHEVLPIGCVILGATFSLDRIMYGKWIFVPLRFFQFNFLSGGGDFYGSHPWHWYFTQGFPAMAFTHLPLAVLGIWWSREWFLAGLVAWILFTYSLLGHKEFRFVLPALPLAMLFAGYSLASIEAGSKKIVKEKSGGRWPLKLTIILIGLLVSNAPTALYTSLVHQRGSEAVMEYLGKEATDQRVESIAFLTQCHATPFYSSLHKDLPMRFLDCSPSSDGGKDEASRFMEDPLAALSVMFGDGNVPSHIVFFDSLEDKLRPFLEARSYKLVKKVFHAHFPVDRELQAYLCVFSTTKRPLSTASESIHSR